MADNSHPTSQAAYIRRGTAVSLALALLFLFRGKWRLARIAGGFTVAFVEKWRESRLAREVEKVLTRAGSRP